MDRSPDMDVEEGPCSSSAAGGPKKDKLCLVCGDKALGYNFNAVSCESCKAFFRRNAHKVIRGRCEGQCEVTVESRSFCKRCRLAKCFAVGMRKDMILNDEQKMQRKQKIIINKLRRQGTLPPQDTYSASSKDLLSPVRGMVAKDPDQCLQQYNQGLVDTRIASSPDLLSGLDPLLEPLTPMEPITPSPPGSVGSSTPALQAPRSSTPGQGQVVIAYRPWSESQEEVSEAISEMSLADQGLTYELMAAMESGQFLAMTSSSMRMLPNSPEEFVNLAETFIRKVIKMAKHVAYFKQLHKDDQISLLKGSVVDIMMLRSAINYDPFTESWSLSTRACLTDGSSQACGERISAEILKASSPETQQLFLTYSKFIRALMATIHGDLLALKLLIVMSLFSASSAPADRLPMVNHALVQQMQETYACILEEYLIRRFNNEPTLFARVISKLTDLRNINEVHSKMLLTMKMDELVPLLLEIFDLPTDAPPASPGALHPGAPSPAPGGPPALTHGLPHVSHRSSHHEFPLYAAANEHAVFRIFLRASELKDGDLV